MHGSLIYTDLSKYISEIPPVPHQGHVPILQCNLFQRWIDFVSSTSFELPKTENNSKKVQLANEGDEEPSSELLPAICQISGEGTA